MLVRLNCGYQNYDWGKLGLSSAVAQLVSANDPDVQIDLLRPYAELWMGTHPKLPSKLRDAEEAGKYKDLQALVEAEPEVLGAATKFGDKQLPFLFKVLSIRKALSIQAHPDKTLAQELHARDPENYPDDNHKPEMAIALTDFEGFCGFKPIQELAALLTSVPEFAELTGEAGREFVAFAKEHPVAPHSEYCKPLKALFKAVMTAAASDVEALAPRLVDRAKSDPNAFRDANLAALIIRLNNDFSNDIGLFCGGLMLNYCKLKPGEAMYMGAKVPHAYVSGDIIECMAASDNVVRAGFTPKFKDVSTLVEMLTYTSAPADKQKMTAAPWKAASGGQARLFKPPIEEFDLVEIETSSNTSVAALDCPSIVLFTSGSGSIESGATKMEYARGSVFFVGARTPITIRGNGTSYHAIA